MTIGADGANTGSIRVVNRRCILLVDVVPHLVAGDAKSFRVRRLDAPMQPAPEQNPYNKCQETTRWNAQQIAAPGHTPEFSPTAFVRFARLLRVGMVC